MNYENWIFLSFNGPLFEKFLSFNGPLFESYTKPLIYYKYEYK